MKIKLKRGLESYINFIKDVYILEDESKLNEDAKDLKLHYSYVLKDLLLQDVIKEVD